MSKRANAKYKISRRWGVNLWGRDKDPNNKKNYGPGQHGPVNKGRARSDFGNQLRAKQILKGYYGNMSERQFRKTYEEAIRSKGDSSENLVGLLESRLDTVVYRMNFVPTVFAARQIVNHKHVTVNGKVVNVPSFRLKAGDIVELKEKSRQMPIVIEALKDLERDVPGYLNVNLAEVKGTFMRAPKMDEVPYPVVMEPHLVIEFYSR